MGDDGGGGSGFGQGRGGNEGMSGAPMWQIKRQMEEYEKQRQIMVQDLIKESEEKAKPALAPNIFVDTASAGGPSDPKVKPLVRHVFVKDLNRVADMKRIEFPSTEIFQNKAPIGLFAIFDGGACSGTHGPAAAEYCARNFHAKVMQNLAMLKEQGAANIPFVKAALIKSFHDLDQDYLAAAPPDQDGCGAAVALLIGGHIFTAVLGRCSVILAEMENDKLGPSSMIQRSGTSLKAALGQPALKSAPGSKASATPEVHGVTLKGHDKTPFLFLASSNVAAVLEPAQLVAAAADFTAQPRMACQEVIDGHLAAAVKRNPQQQMVLGQLCFLPDKAEKKTEKEDSKPAAKKLKTDGLKSLRLRHILLTHKDAKPTAHIKAKAQRTKAEAEVKIREIFKDVHKHIKEANKAPKSVNELIILSGKRFNELCRTLSECPTAQKGGAMCGDLGWMSLEELTKLNGTFRERVEPLLPGQWSDVCHSDQGVHLVQRVA